MKKKIAKRFISRNAWKIARLNTNMENYSPSFKKRIKKATSILLKED